MIQTLPFMMA